MPYLALCRLFLPSRVRALSRCPLSLSVVREWSPQPACLFQLETAQFLECQVFHARFLAILRCLVFRVVRPASALSLALRLQIFSQVQHCRNKHQRQTPMFSRLCSSFSKSTLRWHKRRLQSWLSRRCMRLKSARCRERPFMSTHVYTQSHTTHAQRWLPLRTTRTLLTPLLSWKLGTAIRLPRPAQARSSATGKCCRKNRCLKFMRCAPKQRHRAQPQCKLLPAAAKSPQTCWAWMPRRCGIFGIESWRQHSPRPAGRLENGR
mmetsp:Transcript_75619/g.122790  ORF Transcript_75619/g.122790 Transcript_75619/m.122790 type:complete len:264 (-) Transcript_75619:532-1323(-)